MIPETWRRQTRLHPAYPISPAKPSSIDTKQPLNTLGLDSLMAIELKLNIETRLKITVPMAAFMESPSVSSLAKAVAKLLGAGGPESGVRSQESETGDAASGDGPDLPTIGGWQPLDLCAAPFNLPAPRLLVPEGPAVAGKSLGVWALDSV